MGMRGRLVRREELKGGVEGRGNVVEERGR